MVTVVHEPQRVTVTHITTRINVVHDTRRVLVTETTPTLRVVTTTERVLVRGTGAQGPAGQDAGRITVTAGATLQQWSAVTIATDGLAYPADNDNPTHAWQTTGVTYTAALTGEEVQVAIGGAMLDTAPLTWTPGPLYLGENGALTSAVPTGGTDTFHLWVGTALTTTTVLVRPQAPIYLLP
jgi:hypothetical protein